MLPIASAINLKRRRITGKNPPPAWDAALPAEGFIEADLAMLGLDSSRFHVHYTHVRTHDKNHVQPDQLTRKSSGNTLSKYTARLTQVQTATQAASYSSDWLPKSATRTPPRAEGRSEHSHCATFNSSPLLASGTKDIS